MHKNPIAVRIHEMYYSYLLAMRNGTERIPLPVTPHTGKGRHLLYPSSLGKCPLQSRWKREGKAPTWEPKEWEKENSFHLMEQGNRVAEVLQEALVWKMGYPSSEDREFYNGDGGCPPLGETVFLTPGFVPEATIHDEKLGVRGRIDGLIVDGKNPKHWTILEIKARSPGRRPKFGDAMQTLTYMLSTGCHSAAIVTIERFKIKVWPLIARGEGFVVQSEWGDEVKERWNTPDMLNFDALEEEIQWFKDYREMDEFSLDIPIPDPFNDKLRGWCCAWEWETRPKYLKTKPSVIGKPKPCCQFWHHCHPAPEAISVIPGQDGSKAVVVDGDEEF